MDRRPIGVFDSGVGGLTVVKGIREVLPSESIVYVGDTARVPYGDRSEEVITQFALEIAGTLLEQDVKALVVACNTISAVCLSDIQNLAGVIPVIGVIQPTVEAALKMTRSNHIGVIATSATIHNGAYVREVQKLDSRVRVTGIATPLLVHMIEEGRWLGHDATRMVIAAYLAEMDSGVDTVMLGCTHYPLIKTLIEEAVGVETTVVDSATPTALALKKLLSEQDLLGNGNRPTQVYFTSDDPQISHGIATAFLGEELELKKLLL